MKRAVAILILALVAGEATGQDLRDTGRRREGVPARDGYRQLFTRVQEGLSSGSVDLFSGHMAPQVYINLTGGENGYFSGNQAHYVLAEYLRKRRLVNLKFSTMGETDSMPYATGSATLFVKGTRGIAQVYVSLARSGEGWSITQLTIY